MPSTVLKPGEYRVHPIKGPQVLVSLILDEPNRVINYGPAWITVTNLIPDSDGDLVANKRGTNNRFAIHGSYVWHIMDVDRERYHIEYNDPPYIVYVRRTKQPRNYAR